MHTIELVIFDCDGVLVDTEALIREALGSTLGSFDLPVPSEPEMMRFRGRSAASVVDMVQSEHGAPLDGFIERWQDRILQAIGTSARPIPGVAAALAQIPVPICVASSGEPEKIRLSLASTGLQHHFRDGALHSASEVANGKPAPDLFLKAAAAHGFEPRHCAVVEDSVPGIQAAIGAGMVAVGFAYETPAGELRDAGAHGVLHSMEELPGLLQALGMPATRPAPCAPAASEVANEARSR